MIKMPNFQVEMISIKLIKLYEKNQKKHPEEQVAKIIKSIEEFGFRNPILLNNLNEKEIVAGHGRLLAAKKLGIEQVPCISVEDLTPGQIKAFRIMDNKSTESEWDYDLLKLEFEEISGLGYDLELTGFDLNEINVGDDHPQSEEDDFNTEQALKVSKHTVELGEVWVLGTHRLMCGDSTNKEIVTTLIGDRVPPLMVTDPPYGVNYNPSWRDEADKKGILGNRYPTRSLGKVENDDTVDWSGAYDLFPGDVVYVWHAHACEVALSLEKIGYQIISQLIWSKPHFALSRGDYHWKHEPCWYAVKKGKPHNWQGSRKECTVWEIAGMNAMGASKDGADEATGHGTQKPIECMYKPILNNSKTGDWVYDPFGGSGSTLIACEKSLRKCLMMEIDPKYCSVIIERWEKYTGLKGEKLTNGQ